MITIVAGDHDIFYSEQEKVEQRVRVFEMFIHPKHNSNGRNNYDFCLLRTQAIKLNGVTTTPVCLPTVTQRPHNCYVAGWGLLSYNGNVAQTLQSIDVDVYSDEYCVNHSNYGNKIDTSVEFCAGALTGGKDACQGDSGGPLVCVQNNKPFVFGLVSWGEDCAKPYYPGIYAEVQTELRWIVSMIDKNGYSHSPWASTIRSTTTKRTTTTFRTTTRETTRQTTTRPTSTRRPTTTKRATITSKPTTSRKLTRTPTFVWTLRDVVEHFCQLVYDFKHFDHYRMDSLCYRFDDFMQRIIRNRRAKCAANVPLNALDLQDAANAANVEEMIRPVKRMIDTRLRSCKWRLNIHRNLESIAQRTQSVYRSRHG